VSTVHAAEPTGKRVPLAMPRVLCVDDDQFVLAGMQRMLHAKFEVHVASGAIAALQLIEESVSSPFSVIVSDLAMPGVTGIALLKRVREVAPDTVRVLLTGHANIDSAIAAVNDGEVFRFLTKPCGASALIGAVSSAAEHYRLAIAERVLLERTLHGSIKALTDVLTLVNPSAFARGARLKRYVARVAAPLGVDNQWEIEIAALLSRLGSVSLPAALVDKLHTGKELTAEEQLLADGVPAMAASFIAEIPRLDGVCEILVYQNTAFDGANSPRRGVRGDSIPLGARILKVATDLDALEASGMVAEVAIGALSARADTYDPRVVAAFVGAIETDTCPVRVKYVRLGEVIPGMVFAADVTGPNGLLLAARGQEVGRALTERLRYSMPEALLDQEVVVIVPDVRAQDR
jgi:response regulator RpfG family c-di-GMP phosphodiesterase